MKLALLGADAATLDVVRVAIDRGDAVVWGCELGGFAPAILRLAPDLLSGEGWEALMTGRVADAVVVARDANEVRRCEQLVKLAQGGVPLLLAHPQFGDPLPYYEVELSQREGGAAVVPLLPGRLHPVVRQLRSALAADVTDGASRAPQIVFERRLSAQSIRSARDQFAHDADLLRYLCGPLTELAAFGPHAADTATRELNLQLKSASGMGIRWNCATSADAAGGVLTVEAESHANVLTMPDGGAWSIDNDEPASAGDWSPVGAALDELERVLDGQQPGVQIGDAIEAMTLVETVDSSVRRSRTIQLRSDRESERETFQATMSAWGCMLLGLVVLAAPIVALLVWLGTPLAHYIPHVAAGVLIVFLLAQLLLWIIPRDN